VSPDWRAGPPDLKLPIPEEQTLGSDLSEDTRDFLIPANTTDVKWIRAADLLPGNPTIVRQAAISIEDGPTFPLADAAEAHRLGQAGTRGKIVLLP
jgi:NADPH:quinone reductase-like Zn-dependent oxidoreductase